MKQKIFLYVRRVVAVLAGILFLAAFTGKFYPVKILDIQLLALTQRVLVNFSVATAVLLAVLVVLTLLFGRIYCSVLCPFGLLQDFLMFVMRRKSKQFKQSQAYKYFIAAAFWGTLLGGSVVLARWIDPYSLFGSGISGAYVGIGAFLTLAVLVWFGGRYFCSHICPVGAVLGLLSRFALFQIYMDDKKCVGCRMCAAKCPTGSIDVENKRINNETCIRCFKCLGGCKFSGMRFGFKPAAEKVPFNADRRRFFVGAAVFAVGLAAAKGGIELSKRVVTKMRQIIFPAGAGKAQDFANRCLNCNLCVQNCPMKIIKKADEHCSTIHIDYEDSFCDYNCNRCSQVCPSGALKRLSLEEKQRTKIGTAEVDTNICVRCGLCVEECPREVIQKEIGEYPQINADLCIGCGACQCVCPVKAITVKAVDEQKLVS